MTVIHIGSDSEYIKIGLLPSYSAEDWTQANVEIAVCGFRGKIYPWVEAADFVKFTAQLRAIYESLKGEAEFAPLEKQFTLKLVCQSGGHILVTGEAWSQATYGNNLAFVLEIDQSFLIGPLRELESMISASKTIIA